ncbi:MAG: hypothetical protein Q8P67_10270 [archaeon]|nr:hypothetical protein [archaeon]
MPSIFEQIPSVYPAQRTRSNVHHLKNKRRRRRCYREERGEECNSGNPSAKEHPQTMTCRLLIGLGLKRKEQKKEQKKKSIDRVGWFAGAVLFLSLSLVLCSFSIAATI